MVRERDEIYVTIAKQLSWNGPFQEAAAEHRETLSRHPLDHDSRLGLEPRALALKGR